MGIQLITDSASDITQEKAKQWGLRVLPLTTIFGDQEYLDGVTMSHREFFEKLVETDQLPKTSQVTPFAFEEVFQQAVDAGDDVVCITISSKLSGTSQSARIAAAEFGDRVHVVDSMTVCIGQQILVELAVQLRDQGRSALEIVDVLEEKKSHIRVIGLLDTLEYLKRGGRISAAAAFAGSMLSIKPVVCVQDGVVNLIGKARGSRNGQNMLTDMMRKEGGVDFSMPLCMGYTGLSDALLQKYMADSRPLYADKLDALPVSTIGSTIGTHAGPGAIAAAFFVKN